MKDKKIILITGGNSGIGYQAVLRMIDSGHKVILPCRTEAKIIQIIEKLDKHYKKSIDLCERIHTPLLDLSDLSMIDQFFIEINSKFHFIDVLILNAGLQYTGSIKPKLSKQSFELTFAVNHLGHHYLTHKLLPLIIKASSPRIIITSSEVHNPKSPGGQIGKPAGLGELNNIDNFKDSKMLNGSQFSADKAYKDSKLCNLLFARELNKRLEEKGIKIPVIAWAPGLVIPKGREGFFRYSRQYNEFGQQLFAFIARDLFKITEKVEKAGELLFSLAIQEKFNIQNFKFYTNRLISPGKFIFEESKISKEASSKKLANKLWDISNQICGLENDYLDKL